MSAAMAATPYCHRELKALEHPGPEEKLIEFVVTLTFD
jgi:hypothetical protein